VDDASTDGTREMLKQHEDGIKVFYHETNQGKGASIRTVLPHITGDIVIIQDADLEYDPSEYPRLITPILEGQTWSWPRFLGDPPRSSSWHLSEIRSSPRCPTY
jgi:glycosyltransferase involved in cell wall biosynthesis